MHHILPWVLATSSVALLLCAGVLALFAARKRSAEALPAQWALSPRPVFSTDERRVYRQLREALPHHIVLSKLPLVRFCQPTDPRQVAYWYRLLGAIHATFAVCSANGRVLLVIDLEDLRTGSQRSIRIKQSVLAACRVRYLRCAPHHLPSIAELHLLVPQTGDTARGPQPAPSLGRTRETLATNRRERTTLWHESSFMQDSFFGLDSGHEPGAPSGFGALRGGVPVREAVPPPADPAGVVVDTRAAKLRH